MMENQKILEIKGERFWMYIKETGEYNENTKKKKD